MAAVLTRDIVKKFGEVSAVNGISLAVPDGEFMVLLGPSGCGKTTFLRIICGLEKQTSGDLLIGGDVVNDIPPRAPGGALPNLDPKCRAPARTEIKQFQQRVGVTTIYVTHDQVEAMAMGDRIAVIDHGRICQVGTPTEIYDDPADRFVATFVGTPPMNLVARNGGYLGFRPENFLPKEMIDDGAFTEFSFRVDRSEYLGSERIVYGALEGFDPDQVVTAKLPPAHRSAE